jgi:hypothetical protein
MSPYKLAEEWLRAHAEEVVQHLQPAARRQGNEYIVGDLDGSAGQSLHITVKGPKTGLWKDFANGEKASRSLCQLWKAVRGIAPLDHATFFVELSSFCGQSFGYEPPGPINWQKCLDDWTQADADKLALLRKYSPEFVRELHDVNRGVGMQYGRIVFPVIAPDGTLSGVHRYFEEERTLKFSLGTKVHPLIFGDMSGGPITAVHLHESRWDCYALASVSGWHRKEGVRFISTLSSTNGRLVKGQIPPGAKVFCWAQNDSSSNGENANQKWFKAVAKNAGCQILRVEIPSEYKDFNDWSRAQLVTELELEEALSSAQPFEIGGREVSSGATATALPQEVSELFPSSEERPCYRLYDTPFEDVGKSWAPGVYFHGIQEKTVRGETTIRLIDRWICSVVRVLAVTRTTEDKEHSYLLEFIPHGNNVIRREVIPQSLLVGHITELMQFLRPLGISVLFENRELIRDYLDHEHRKFSAQNPEHFLEAVKTPGWHSVGRTFVLPTEIIGDATGVWFHGKNAALYGKGGTLEGWKTEVAAPCEGNSYLILGLSCALAGPLLEPLTIPGAGIHLYGVSTLGKSTVLAVGGSAWGQERFAITWSTTINGLEAAAECRSSTLMPIDESHQVDASVLDKAVYMLLNRTGKARMNKDMSARDIAH